jgi:hypothetical protein
VRNPTGSALVEWTSSTSDYHSSADACMAGPMQKAGSAVDADTSFRAAARTSPGAVSDLQRAEGAFDASCCRSGQFAI